MDGASELLETPSDEPRRVRCDGVTATVRRTCRGKESWHWPTRQCIIYTHRPHILTPWEKLTDGRGSAGKLQNRGTALRDRRNRVSGGDAEAKLIDHTQLVNFTTTHTGQTHHLLFRTLFLLQIFSPSSSSTFDGSKPFASPAKVYRKVCIGVHGCSSLR